MLPPYLSDQKEPAHILEALEMLLLLNNDLSQRAPSVAIKPPNQKRCCLQISTRAPLDRKFPPDALWSQPVIYKSIRWVWSLSTAGPLVTIV